MKLVAQSNDGKYLDLEAYLTTEDVAELAGAACLALTALLNGKSPHNALALRLDAALSRVRHTEHGKATRG